jgi:hypothetical protein
MGNDLMLPIAEGREDQGIFQGETGAVSSSRTPMARNRRRSHHPANLGKFHRIINFGTQHPSVSARWTCVHRNYVALRNESDAAKIDISRSGSQQLAIAIGEELERDKQTSIENAKVAGEGAHSQ